MLKHYSQPFCLFVPLADNVSQCLWLVGNTFRRNSDRNACDESGNRDQAFHGWPDCIFKIAYRHA